MKKTKYLVLTTIIFIIILTNFSVLGTENNLNKNNTKLEDKNIRKLDFGVTLSTNKEKYTWIFEPVEINITLQNTGFSSINFTFPTTQVFDVVIKNRFDIEIYRWSDKMVFIPDETEIKLTPGENKSWNITWHQRGNYLKFLPRHILLPGQYSIQAIIPADTTMKSMEKEISINFFQ